MNQIYSPEPAEASIDLKEYVYLFWSWAWMIVLAGLVAAGLAYFLSSREIPTYEATVSMLVSNPPDISSVDNYSSMINTYTMPNTYAEMVVVSPVMQGVIDKLQLTDMTAEELKSNLSVNLVTDTQILVVTVNDIDPNRAANIANTTAEVFAEHVRQIYAQRYASSKEGIQTQMDDIAAKIDAINTKLDTTISDSERVQLNARLNEYTSSLSDMVMIYEQVRLAEAQTSANIVVTEPASPDPFPVSPRTSRNTLLAGLVGMLLAAGVVFAIDLMDDTIKNPEEVRRTYNLPILGVIARHEVPVDKPIAEAEPRSPVAESFRALRTNITFAAVDTPLRKIVITSPTPQDGKTTVSSNLAVVMAQGEKKVVLIDADLRRPQIHRRFGLLNRVGLSDLFVKPVEDIGDSLQPTSSPRLAIIPSGALPPNPAELLTSQRMSLILEKLLEAFETVIIDTPPVLTVTDAAALAKSVDGVVLVVKPGGTKRSALRQSLETLQGVKANLLGIVLNDVDTHNRSYGYYYGHYYSSGYYYDAEGNKKKSKGKKKDLTAVGE